MFSSIMFAVTYSSSSQSLIDSLLMMMNSSISSRMMNVYVDLIFNSNTYIQIKKNMTLTLTANQ